MNTINNFFTRKIRVSNLEIGLVKLTVYCLGIAIGAHFVDIFRPHVLLLVGVGLATGIWAGVIWLKAMKETS
jgi:hypothetical protein